MRGSEFIFRGLGSGNGVTEERINQEKKLYYGIYRTQTYPDFCTS